MEEANVILLTLEQYAYLCVLELLTGRRDPYCLEEQLHLDKWNARMLSAGLGKDWPPREKRILN